MIRLARPEFDEKELAAALEVLRTGMLTQGAHVAAFEAACARRCGRTYGVAVSSGTSALYLALSALQLGPSDEVLVPALTWPSPAHAVIAVGAAPVLVDVDPQSWNATAENYRRARSDATRAAIVIDQFGAPVDRASIEDALQDLLVIEDAACAIGSRFADGRPCGSFGLVSCLSFHPRKVITTGEGGMCLTDRIDLAKELRSLRNHGQAEAGRFEHAALNHRLTEVAAVLGQGQLQRLDETVAIRQALADRYRNRLDENKRSGEMPLTRQEYPAGASSNVQTFGVVLNAGNRDEIIARLRTLGVEAGRLSYALHQIKPIAEKARIPSALLHAETIANQGLALPLHPQMDLNDCDVVVDKLCSCLSGLSYSH
ncbi:MAG: DegT/DnrJ/EryC1/StrS family aminotransferase [Myxococcota bacterium]